MSGRKRQYREKIKCIICHMIFDNDYQVKHNKKLKHLVVLVRDKGY